ncbi:ABC transporter substrate-binding protein [Alginatibacterium sediminis]|uniref:ABC transporter substrate-binding protein n=1 Tax=Alginatibacterium sediminis TaxID=2164068 RepID=A0A420E9Y5_9ALTE|nr:ABC transporter substrate-binding protein [Alginatibacterium sediminis]RKF17480.1 ABC transporter substrate-binding protein [Alginatibacterium sediminis]
MKFRNLATSLALSATLLSAQAFAELTIGFSQIGAESAWRSAETESIKSEAEKRGYTLKFSDAQQKQENQIKAIRSFIAQGVDGIILAPVVETGWDRVLKEAKAADIPVVLVDRGIKVKDNDLYLSKIASDFVFEGKLAGAWLAQETNGYANIVELQGGPGAAPAIDRKAGFGQMVEQFPGMEITASQTGEWTRTKGKEVMEAFLKAQGEEIDAVYAHNDDMALGAIQAIKEFGLMPGKDILVVSIDGVKAAFQAMVDGELNATVDCNPLLGPLAFDALEMAFNGKDVDKWIVQKDKINVQQDAAEMIDSRMF